MVFDPISPTVLTPLIWSGITKLGKSAATEKLKELFKKPEVQEAWEKACNHVSRDTPLFNEYIGEAIRTSPNPEETKRLDDSMKSYFEDAGFPTREELQTLLLEGWKERKASLTSDDAAEFFKLQQSEVAPILGRLATAFFIELTQNPRFFNPVVTEALQKLQELLVAKSGAGLTPEGAKASAEALQKDFAKLVPKLFKDILLPETTRFPITCSKEDDPNAVFDAQGLLTEVAAEKRVLLIGPAGYGKSSVLARVAKQLVNSSQYLPLVLDVTQLRSSFERFRQAPSNEGELQQQWWLVLGAVQPGVSVEDLDKLTDFYPPFLLVDKLNEVPGPEVAYNILKTIYRFATRLKDSQPCVVAALRQIPEGLEYDWSVITIKALPEAFVEQQVGKEQFGRLSQPVKDLLTIPYYLQLAALSGVPEQGTAASAIEGFLRKRVMVDEEDLNKAAVAAFDAYEHNETTRFDIKAFTDKAGSKVWKVLFEAGTVRSIDSEEAAFQHQLYHDYFAARYCVLQHLWTDIGAFDTISLKANSFNAVQMVIEQMNEVQSGDDFLRTVYDWNLTAAIESLRDVEEVDPKKYTAEMYLALLALMSEKLFDNVRSTRTNAVNQFRKFRSEVARQIVSAKKIEDIFTLVQKQKSGHSWFEEWRSLFTQPEGMSEEQVSLINSRDAILGWTSANVIRRFAADQVRSAQLREIYRSHKAAANPNHFPDFSDTVRWRAVHALGVFPDDANLKLLLDALDDDRYHWTKYGAARSLVECAARTPQPEIRAKVIKELKERIKKLSDGSLFSKRILDEVGRTVFYLGAIGGWKESAMVLLKSVLESQTDSGQIDAWKRKLDDFASWNSEQAVPA